MGLVETILLIVALIVAAMVLIVVEVCTPTFGVLAAGAIACAGGAVYLAFTIDIAVGVIATLAALIGLPVYAYGAVKIMPRTALGRALMLRRERSKPGEGTPEAEGLHRLIGRKTTAETTLRPSGTIRIDGQRIVAQAESGMIEKGQAVRIIGAGGNYVVVRKAEEEP